MKKVEVKKLNDKDYVVGLISEILKRVEINYTNIDVEWKDELASVTYKKKDKIKHIRRLKPWKPIKMVYVNVTNNPDVEDDAYDYFYRRVGFLVEDNHLVDKGYDITAILLG